MEIYSDIKQIPKLSIALGFFDGVHLGHQTVISRTVSYAKEMDTKSAVITFKDHPCSYFYDLTPEYVLTREIRRERIANLGADYLFELDFSKYATLTAQEYLEDTLVKNFSPIGITTGFNHNFGKDRGGGTEFLQANSSCYGYKYFLIPPQKLNDEVISSTAIRLALKEGNIEKSNAMLGYKFYINGTVVRGKQLGKTLGFPTANLTYPQELIRLPLGVYVTKTTYNGRIYQSITNVGKCPTVADCYDVCTETHILNFDTNIYGKHLTVEFLHYLRPEKKFSSILELKQQINEDLERVKQISKTN